MSFRLRIFLLVMVVAVTAIGATAWLTLSLAYREISRATVSADAHRAAIAARISAYGRQHGRWPGVDGLAWDLSQQTGLHIRLVTLDQTVIVDTDNLAQRAAGPVQLGPVIDARPGIGLWAGSPGSAVALSNDPKRYGGLPTESPTATGARRADGSTQTPESLFQPLPTGVKGASPLEQMLHQLDQYRAAVRTVQCIADASPGTQQAVELDQPPYLSAKQIKDDPACLARATREVTGDGKRRALDIRTYRQCSSPIPARDLACAVKTFNDRVQVTAAVPLQLYLGGPSGMTIDQLGRPAAFGAAGLIVVALIGTGWIARLVSRPVRRLTDASRQLADGRLDARVSAHGRGELARLSASFNAMAEAVQRSEERQRRLVADVAHEIRTPLSNLCGYLEGLSDGFVEPGRELFASLHEEALLQRRILDDLQVLTQAENGDLRYTKAPIDLAELVETAATVHRAVAAEAGVAMTVDGPTPTWVMADSDRLRQVLGNLLTNAVRYTDSGGHILLRVRQHSGEARLTVQDTGVGMSAGDLHRVFDRFWRADPARQRSTGGSGLGMTIAQRIVHDHGGRIEVTSEPGVGTTFTVHLPSTEPAPSPVLTGLGGVALVDHPQADQGDHRLVVGDRPTLLGDQ